MSYTLQFGQVWHYLPYLLAGAWITLQISFLAFWGGMVIGLLGAAGLTYGGRLTRAFVGAYVTFFTNTPGLVQIYFYFYAMPEFGVVLTSYQAVLLGLTLNAGAYITLIQRGGFLSVRQNELDAAATLGMSLIQSVRYVIIPHIARVLYAPLSSKFILMVLGSAVGGVFGLEELTGRTINANSESFRAIELFSMTALIYVALTILASALLAVIGRFVFRVKVSVL
jgi:polar amino acid transport system permease protein